MNDLKLLLAKYKHLPLYMQTLIPALIIVILYLYYRSGKSTVTSISEPANASSNYDIGGTGDSTITPSVDPSGPHIPNPPYIPDVPPLGHIDKPIGDLSIPISPTIEPGKNK